MERKASNVKTHDCEEHLSQRISPHFTRTIRDPQKGKHVHRTGGNSTCTPSAKGARTTDKAADRVKKNILSEPQHTRTVHQDCPPHRSHLRPLRPPASPTTAVVCGPASGRACKDRGHRQPGPITAPPNQHAGLCTPRAVARPHEHTQAVLVRPRTQATLGGNASS